jgi:hypothetical protein
LKKSASGSASAQGVDASMTQFSILGRNDNKSNDALDARLLDALLAGMGKIVLQYIADVTILLQYYCKYCKP